MSALLRYLELTAKSKTGISTGVIVLGLLAGLFAAVTFGLLIFAAFIFLANRYTPLTAALVLGGFFLLLTVIALISCVLTQRHTVERAKVALAARSATPWLDPRYLGVGMQIGRAIGWRKLLPLAAIAVLSAGMAKEWFGSERRAEQDEDDDDA